MAMSELEDYLAALFDGANDEETPDTDEKITAGTTTSGDFVFTGRITEIIATEPYTIFRVQISEGVEVIVANRSAKSTINSSDVKEKKQIAGTVKGLYDGKTPYIWAWFIWNK